MNSPYASIQNPSAPPMDPPESMMQCVMEGVKNQVEFYFSINNLTGDRYLMEVLSIGNGAAPVIQIAEFPMILQWYQHYLTLHGVPPFLNKKPLHPAELICEAIKSSQSVRVSPDGYYLLPEAWKTMEAIRMRQYASPVPTSVSSQSSDISPHPPHQFFHPSGGFDPRASPMTLNPNAPTYWYTRDSAMDYAPANQGFAGNNYYSSGQQQQQQFGYVVSMEHYETPTMPPMFQPLVGNYVGADFEQHNNHINGLDDDQMPPPPARNRHGHPPKQQLTMLHQQQQPQHPRQELVEADTEPDPDSSFFSSDQVGSKGTPSESSETHFSHKRKQKDKKWKKRGRFEKQQHGQQESVPPNQSHKKHVQLESVPPNQSHKIHLQQKEEQKQHLQEQQREQGKTNSPVLKEADFPPLISNSSTADDNKVDNKGEVGGNEVPKKQRYPQNNKWKKNKKKWKHNEKLAEKNGEVDKVAEEMKEMKVNA